MLYLEAYSDHLVPVDKIPYLDFPELKFNEHESTEMPFRYVKGEDGKPIMPKVSDRPFHTSQVLIWHFRAWLS